MEKIKKNNNNNAIPIFNCSVMFYNAVVYVVYSSVGIQAHRKI